MENPIKLVVKMNKEAGFLDKPFNPWVEAAFLIEEAIEGYDLAEMEARLFNTQRGDAPSSKDLARRILGEHNKTATVAPIDILDKSIDAAIFAIGTMAKLGLNAQQITQAFNIVMHCNLQKLKSVELDSEGKLTKPANFVGPEAKLQELLDSL